MTWKGRGTAGAPRVLDKCASKPQNRNLAAGPRASMPAAAAEEVPRGGRILKISTSRVPVRVRMAGYVQSGQVLSTSGVRSDGSRRSRARNTGRGAGSSNRRARGAAGADSRSNTGLRGACGGCCLTTCPRKIAVSTPHPSLRL